MAQNKKHVGALVSGTRIALVMAQLPDAPLKSLIIELDSLPPYHEELLRNVLISDPAQEARDLADVMGSTNVPGLGRSLMLEFHKHGFMRSESIDNIILTPNDKTSVPLREVLAAMGKLGVAAALATKAEKAVSVLSPEDEAAALIAEADVLTTRASALREKAAALLQPKIEEVAAMEQTTTQVSA